MKRLIKLKDLPKLIVCTGFILLSIIFLSVTEVRAKEVTTSSVDTTSKDKKEEYSDKVQELMRFLAGSEDTFAYKREGRPDPFMPFISEKVISSEFDVPEEILEGMRKFEPGQLTLVAIVFAEDGPLAMVQDSVGKGYIIKNGTEIGRSGFVDEITANLVVVKERYKTSAGEERFRIVEMLLKKEGEQ